MTKPKRIKLSCGHMLYYKTWLPEGDTLFCHECQTYVDVRVPAPIMAGQTYEPEYDCTIEPVTGKRGRYLVRCTKCEWTREGSYHTSMDNMHKHQTNTHTRWGNDQLALEGF